MAEWSGKRRVVRVPSRSSPPSMAALEPRVSVHSTLAAPPPAVDHAPVVAGDMALPGSAHGLTGGIKSRLLGLRM
jgi:hypothetical protein